MGFCHPTAIVTKAAASLPRYPSRGAGELRGLWPGPDLASSRCWGLTQEGWQKQPGSTSLSWLTFRNLAQGCLLRASKYLEAQAPDDLNVLCQFTFLHSLICSISVDLSSILLPLTMPCGISGASQAELRGAGRACHAATRGQASPVTCSLTPRVLLRECGADTTIRLVGRHRYPPTICFLLSAT